ncbi:L,D-transpeptidase [Leptolyngbya sp. BL0902]|nr:L,D-transpeptidase [Leptolyngbya sp. BL0902]
MGLAWGGGLALWSTGMMISGPSWGYSPNRPLPLAPDAQAVTAVDIDPWPLLPLGEAADHLPPRIAPIQATHVVLRISERRVYLYDGDWAWASYPVAVGRQGWATPTGQFVVQRKQADPTWRHPFTGELVPPGPENPLGRHWVGFWSDGNNVIGFHGTPQEDLIGQAVSHGCVRMRNADIAEFFDRVQVGTPVLVEP